MYLREERERERKQSKWIIIKVVVFNIIFITCYQSLHNSDKKCLITMRYYYDVLLKIWKFSAITIMDEGKLCCTKAYFTPLSMIKIWIYRSLWAMSEYLARRMLEICWCDFGVRYDDGRWWANLIFQLFAVLFFGNWFDRYRECWI